jgi:hypothetical protein
MAIEEYVFEMLPEALDDGRSECEVRNKMAALAVSYPSMTSMCSESAPACTILLHSSSSIAKSHDRIDGEMFAANFFNMPCYYIRFIDHTGPMELILAFCLYTAS